ncbi:MAG: B12-binding domain-containing radical SAM protein [Lachnospiraceae bacterium]|nr:B12-binding domain-containing radical SAM protein [Lachnospiraceae bacterium]MDE6185998.1 B12-binding domain-containing radical SAM protein [Lachnospiraceae bacterium]
MQFLLTAINAKYIHSNPAVYSLMAYAGEGLKSHIEVAEYTINQKMEEILGDLYKRRPDVIGFSCYIWNYPLIQELLRELPKVLPDVELWLGGPEVTYEGRKILKEFPMVKGIMAGEGEETFKELLSFYVEEQERERLVEIPGLILRKGDCRARKVTDLNAIPFLYNDLQTFENRIIYYETSRGCPFRCSYCLSSIDKSVRLRSLELVKKELQFFLDKRVPQVKLIDRTFNCNRDHAMEIWKYIQENDNGVTNFHFEIAADIMDAEELTLLKEMRPGLVQFEIGVQTTNPETLREINRRTDISRIEKVVEAIHENRNIHVHLDLIAGLPFEGYDRFRQSFNDVYGMKPQQLQLGFLKVLKGTLIREKAEDYGIVYQEKAPYEVLYTKWLSYKEVLQLKRIEEMVELYYNSNQFTHTLSVLEGEFRGAFEMFEQLAEFYEQKGYFMNSPARSRRYHVLLEFALNKALAKEQLYRELLTYDYYLRENAKSRPSFCTDLSPYREEIWNFYQQEEAKPVLLQNYREYHARQTMKMTHMDVFFYPVWKEGEDLLGARSVEPTLVLFDYEKRDALTREALTRKALQGHPSWGVPS